MKILRRRQALKILESNRLPEKVPSDRDLAKARDAFDEAHHRFGEYDFNTAAWAGRLAEIYRMRGSYRDALPYYSKALKGFDRAAGPLNPLSISTKSNMAGVCGLLGEHAKAIRLYEEVLSARRRTLGSHPKVAETLSNLGMQYETVAFYEAADQCLRESLDIMKSALGEESYEAAMVLDNLGVLHARTGEYDRAEEIWRRTLATFEHQDPPRELDVATTLENLGINESNLGRTKDAERSLLQAAAIRRRLQGEEHPELGRVLGRLGELSLKIRPPLDAEIVLIKALSILSNTLGSSHPDVAGVLESLGWVSLSEGDCSQAEQRYRESLEAHRQSGSIDRHLLVAPLVMIAVFSVADGRGDEADELLREATAIEVNFLRQAFGISSQTQQLAAAKLIRWTLDIVLSCLVQVMAQAGEPALDPIEVLFSRKGLTAQAMARQHEAVLAGNYPYLARELKALGGLRAEIAAMAVGGLASAWHLEPVGDRRHRDEEVRRLESERDQLEAALARSIPETESWLWIGRTGSAADRIVDALPITSALIEFLIWRPVNFEGLRNPDAPFFGAPRYCACILGKSTGNRSVFVDLGDSVAIDTEIERLRALMSPLRLSREHPTSDGALEEFCRMSERLKALIVDPIYCHVRGLSHLYISPDGELWRFPLEVLPVESGRFLLEEFDVTYISSGRDILDFGRKFVRGNDAFVAGDPDFDARMPNEGPTGRVDEENAGGPRRSIPRFRRLRGTAREAMSVAVLLGSRPLLGADVLKPVVMAVRSPRIFHLATHAFFLESHESPDGEDKINVGSDVKTWSALALGKNLVTSPSTDPMLQSGLALAGVNTWFREENPPRGAQDGILSAQDVLSMDLVGTELVVLSACDTGLGGIRSGEGVFGLRRAFIVAGARAIVMSLWKVSDSVTQELIEDFYARIAKGESKSVALRASRLAVRSKHPHPYYWGAFIFQGDPAPLC